MLLFELIDTYNARKTKRSTDPWTFPERMAGKNRDKSLGSGVSAVAFKSHKPNTVIKTSYHENLNDGYIQYIRTIMKHQDNPFFPRIYNAKIYKPDEGNDLYALVMEMEKLISLLDPKIIDITPRILQQVGLNFDKNKLVIMFSDADNRRKLRQSTKNPKFSEALTVLEPFFEEFEADLHRKNMMVRLTKSGPQLVLTDPLAPSAIPYAIRSA